MSEFASEAAAAEALANANAGDIAPPSAPVEQAPVTEGTQHVETGTTQTSESFTNLDLNSVPEELRPLIEEKFNQFNADYTRKTQEIAPIRQLMSDTGFSADEARQALEFVQSLNDPDALRNLYTNLSEQFNNEQGGEDLSQGYGDEVDPRDQQIQGLEERLGRFEQAQAMQQAEAQLHTALSQVKSAHPDWSDSDMERVQKLAVVHMQSPNADIGRALTAAADEFKGWRDEVLGSYIEGKGNVTTGGTPAMTQTTHAQTPEAFSNLDDATKAALARFGADWAQ